MLFNAKATLNESMDYIISTYELQQQLLLVCLSAISILNQETESPIKKNHSTEGLFFLLTILLIKLLNYSRVGKNREYMRKKEKRHPAYCLSCRTVLLVQDRVLLLLKPVQMFAQEGGALKTRAIPANNKH